VINEQPEKVETLLQNYFSTLKFYHSNRDTMVNEFMLDSDLSAEAANKVVDSIDWINLTRNASKWFGIRSDQNPLPHFDIVESIRLTDDILLKFGDFTTSPLPAQGPFHLLSSRSITKLYSKQNSGEKIEGIDTHFSKLSHHQWN